jgi:hypothetical protein
MPIGGLKAKRSYLALELLVGKLIGVLERSEPIKGPVIFADPKPMTLAEFLNHLLALEASYKGLEPRKPKILTIPQWLLKSIIKTLKPDLWAKLGEDLIAEGTVL